MQGQAFFGRLRHNRQIRGQRWFWEIKQVASLCSTTEPVSAARTPYSLSVLCINTPLLPNPYSILTGPEACSLPDNLSSAL
jgi:hypothetical protein